MSAIRGWKGYVRIANNKSNLANAPEPYLRTAPFSMEGNLEAIFIIGNKNAQFISEGNLELSGSIERVVLTDNSSNKIIWNDSAIDLATAAGVYGDDLQEFIMHIAPNGSGTAPEFFLRGVKFANYEISIEAGEIVVESANWIAKNISTA